MSQTVETKVVELQFKSDDFAKKAEEASTRLELLNRKLDDFQRNGLSGITKSAKNVNVDSLGDSVDQASKKFNAFEKIATGALMTIGNYVTRTGANLFKNLISPITSGGLQRAMNIEQASFQFEGLGVEKSKGNENLSYYKEVMDAVLGTAYSYDVAAKAASQLATSNIGVTESTKKLADGSKKSVKVMNEDMTKAILAIAGASAMSGAQFEQIADIFLNAAGKGAAMGDEFRRLSINSINGYQIMADYFGKTVDEVRKMASKGEISFNDFATAMSDAYGSHAKESTKTFTGALEDMKAALSRIGADFYGPNLEGVRDILNSLTPLVDVLHDKISGALGASNNLLGKAAEKLTVILDLLSYVGSMRSMMGSSDTFDSWFGDNLTHYANILDGFGDTSGIVLKGIEELGSGLKEFGKIKIDGFKMLADYLGLTGDEIKTGITDGTIGLEEFDKALLDLYDNSEKLQKVIKRDDLKNWLKSFMTEDNPYGTAEISKNVVAVYSRMNGILDALKEFVATVGKAIISVGKVVGKIFIALEPLWKLLDQTAMSFVDFIDAIFSHINNSKGFDILVNGINKLLTGITKLFHVSEIAGAAATVIIRIFDELAQAVKAVYDGVVKIVNTVLELLDHTIEKLAATFGNVSVLIKMIKKLGLFALLGALAKGIDTLFQPFEYATNIVDMLKNMFKSLENVFKNIEKLSGGVKSVFSNLASGLEELTKSIRADTVIKYAIALSMLAGSLYLLSQIDAEKASQSVGLFGSTVAGLVASFAIITGIMAKADKAAKDGEKGNFLERILGKFVGDGSNKYKDVGNFMLKMAAAVFVLAAAMKIVGDLPSDKIIYAAGAIELLLLTMAGVAKVLEGTSSVTMSFSKGFEKSSKGITKGLTGLIAMAGAVYILAKAMENLSNLDADKLATSFAFMSVILWELVGVVYAMSKFEANGFLKAAVSLLIFAKAVEMFMNNLKILSEFEDQDALNNAMIKLAELVAMLTVATIALSQFGGMGVFDAAAVYIFVQSVTALVDGLKLLTTLDAESMANSFKYLVTLMAVLVLAVGALGAMGSVGLGASIAIYIFVQAIDVLVESLLKIAGANITAVGQAIIALAGAIFVLGVSCAVFKIIPLGGILKFGLALGIVVLAAAGFGVAAFAIGLGMQAIAMGIEALAAVLPYMGEFAASFMAVVILLAAAIAILSPFTGALLLLGVAFGLFAVSILGIGAGIQMLASAMQTLTRLKDQLPAVADSLKTFFKSVKGLSKESSSLDEAASTISSSLTKMGNAAADAAKKFAGFKTAGRNIVKDLAGGITEGTAASDAIKTILNKAISTSKTYTSKFYSIGANLVKGMINGINSQLPALRTAVQKLEAQAEKAVEAKAKIKSPSRVWAKIGSYLGMGLAKGITNSASRVISASEDLADVSTDAMTSAIGLISDRLENGDFTPTITPVVDLSQAVASASELSSMFSADKAMSVAASINSQVSPVDRITSALGALGSMMGQGGTTNNYNLNGLTYSNGSEIAQAMEVLANAVLVNGRA